MAIEQWEFGHNSNIQRRIYEGPLAKRGIDAIYPPPSNQKTIMNIIQNELIRVVFLDQSREPLEVNLYLLATSNQKHSGFAQHRQSVYEMSLIL
jgi:aspartate/glutamate racemase